MVETSLRILSVHKSSHSRLYSRLYSDYIPEYDYEKEIVEIRVFRVFPCSLNNITRYK